MTLHPTELGTLREAVVFRRAGLVARTACWGIRLALRVLGRTDQERDFMLWHVVVSLAGSYFANCRGDLDQMAAFLGGITQAKHIGFEMPEDEAPPDVRPRDGRTTVRPTIFH